LAGAHAVEGLLQLAYTPNLRVTDLGDHITRREAGGIRLTSRRNADHLHASVRLPHRQSELGWYCADISSRAWLLGTLRQSRLRFRRSLRHGHPQLYR